MIKTSESLSSFNIDGIDEKVDKISKLELLFNGDTSRLIQDKDLTKVLSLGDAESEINRFVKAASKGDDAQREFLDSFRDSEEYMRGYFSSTDRATLSAKELAKASKAARIEQELHNKEISSGGLKGMGVNLLKNVGAMALNMAAIAAIGWVISQFVAAWQEKKQAIEDATVAVKEHQESINALQDQETRVKELRSQIDSGSLSDEDIYNAKQQILEIQQSIVDKYGEQAAGVDLVNGSLETQHEILMGIAQEKAKEQLKENRSAINNARNDLDDSNKSYGLLSVRDSASIDKKDANWQKQKEKLGDYIESLKDMGFDITKEESTASGWKTLEFSIEGDADQALQVMDLVMDKQKELSEGLTGYDLESFNTATNLQGIYDNLSKKYEKSIELLKQESELNLEASPTGSKYLEDYAKSVKDVQDAFTRNDSFSEEGSVKIDVALENYEETKSQLGSIQESFPNTEHLFEGLDSQISETAINTHKFFKELTASGELDGLKKDFENFSDIDLKSLGTDTLSDSGIFSRNLKENIETSTKEGFFGAFSSIGDSVSETFSSPTDLSAWDNLRLKATQAGVPILDMIDGLVKLDVVSGASIESIQRSFGELKSEVQSTSEAQSLLNTAYAESSSGQGISIDTYDQLKDRYGAAFERTANGIVLNTKKLNELKSAEKDVMKNNFQKRQSELTSEIVKNQREIDSLNDTIKQFGENSSEAADASARISELSFTNQSLSTEVDKIKDLESQYKGATSAYQAWKDAQSTPNDGAMYDDVYSGIKTAGELYKEGLVGTDDFRTFAQLTTDQDLSLATIEEIVAAYEKGAPKLKKYFTEGQEGCESFLTDISNLNSEWAHINEDGKWEIDFGANNDEEIAQALGINVEAVQMALKKLREFGFEIDLDNPNDQLALLEKKAEKAQKELEELDQTDPKVTIEAVNAAEQEVEEAKQAVEDYRNQNAHLILDVDTDEAQARLSETYTLLSAYKQAAIDLNNNPPGSKGYKTAKDNIEALIPSIEALPDDIKFHYKIEGDDPATIAQKLIDGTIPIPTEFEPPSEEGLTGIQQVIENLNGTTITVNVDTADATTSITDFKTLVESVKETITVTATAIVDSAIAAIENLNNKINSMVTSKQITVTTVNKTVNEGAANGTANVNGTAFINGSVNKPSYGNYKNRNFLGSYPERVAKANGDWSVPKDTTALVGELGTELLVRDGQWHTIGDQGAGFANIKQGDIIFNHRQTEELFKNGRVTSGGGRGKSFAEGTAYSKGSGAFFNNGKWTPTPSKNKNKTNTKPAKETAKAAKETKKAVEETAKEFKEVMDWAEIKLKRLKSVFDRMLETTQDVLQTYKEQSRWIDKTIANGYAYIGVLSQQEALYINKANAVGLEASYVEKIKNGTIAIEDITDEDLNERIQDYQKWYELAIDAREEIEDLNKELRELAVQKLDNIADDFDRIISRAQALNSLTQSKVDLKNAKGVSTSRDDFNKLIQDQADMESHYTAYLSKLNGQFLAMIDAKIIVPYTDEFYEWKEKIADIENSIYDAKIAMQNFKQEILQLEFDKLDKLIEKMDTITSQTSLYDELLGNAKNFKENSATKDKDGNVITKSEVTDAGYTRLGLMMQNLGVAKQKVADYEEAIKQLGQHLKAGNISQEKYNEQLAEYKQAQMQATSEVHKAKQAYIDFMKEGIDAATESYRKLIDAQKEALQEEDKDIDWNKQVEEQEKKILAVRKKIDALAGDNSKEAAAKRKKLEQELADEIEAQEEMYRKKELEQNIEKLDKDFEEFEKDQEDRKEVLDSSLTAQESAIKELADFTLQNQNSVYDGLAALTDEYKGHFHENVIDPWKDATDALKMYEDALAHVADINPSKELDGGYGGKISGSQGNTWKKNSVGWWLEDANGGYAQNTWAQQGDDWFHFDKNGYMQTGWIKDGTDWYYMNKGGYMQTGWFHDGKDWFYATPDGRMQSGWIKDGNDTYYANQDGRMQTGWQAIGGQWYFLDSDGKMLKNAKTPDGYTVGNNGSWLGYRTGSFNTKNGWGFQDEDGVGSEAVITNKGVFRQFQQGETIFNKDQTKRLWEISKTGLLPSNTELLSSSTANPPVQSQDNRVVNFGDNNITINGVDTNNIPEIEKVVSRKLQQHLEDTLLNIHTKL